MTPSLDFGKRWGFFDWQTNLIGSLPVSGIDVLGRQIIFNNTFQFNVAKVIWPELESNTTFYVDGFDHGNTQLSCCPASYLGRSKLPNDFTSSPA